MDQSNRSSGPRDLRWVRAAGGVLRPGDRVRLKPRGGADLLDVVLAGKTATIVAIERDREDRVHLAVIIDEESRRNPGSGRKTAHRFFFDLDEVEPVSNPSIKGT